MRVAMDHLVQCLPDWGWHCEYDVRSGDAIVSGTVPTDGYSFVVRLVVPLRYYSQYAPEEAAPSLRAWLGWKVTSWQDGAAK